MVKILIFHSFSQEHSQSKFLWKREYKYQYFNSFTFARYCFCFNQVFEHLSEKDDVDRYRPII